MWKPPIQSWALWLALVAMLVPVSPQSQVIESNKPIEKLQFAVEWRLVRAGTAILARTPRGNGWQSDLNLDSTGLVSKLFRVKDEYSVLFDSGYCASWTHMHSEEGSRRRDTVVTFDREKKRSYYIEKDLIKQTTFPKKELDIPVCVQDVVAALNRLRGLKLQPGQSVVMPISDGKRIVNAKIEAQEKEAVKTTAGSFQTMRYEANLFNDVLYTRKGRLFIWITDDDRKLPVQIRVKLSFPVGTIGLQLEKIGPT